MKFLNRLQPVFLVTNSICLFYFLAQNNYNLAIISAIGVGCFFVQTKLRETK